MTNCTRAAWFYLDAKTLVIEAGFEDELMWQESRSLEALTESAFLSELAWVILGSGFRASVVRAKFSAISSAFLNWTSAQAICSEAAQCRRSALNHFRNERKVDWIIKGADIIARSGFSAIREKIGREGVEYLGSLPGIGPVTACHLAKNIGFNVAKPDRHLVRLANAFGSASASELCDAISLRTGDPPALVDLVLWRFATLRGTQDIRGETDLPWEHA
jgi:hypothetical protein